MSNIKNETDNDLILRRIREIIEKEPELSQMLLDPNLRTKIQAPDMNLAHIIDCVLETYSNRPALAEREYEIIQDKETDQNIKHYLPRFKAITYGELNSRIKKLANALKSSPHAGLHPKDFACCIGISGIDAVIANNSLYYNHITSVPLPQSSSDQYLSSIIEQTNPKLLITGPKDLEQVAKIACQHKTIKCIVLINYDERVTEDFIVYESVKNSLDHNPSAPVLMNLKEVLLSGDDVWDFLPNNPEDQERISNIIYTSGSTGLPKGVLFTEQHEKYLWRALFHPFPVISLVVMPFHHLGGNRLVTSIMVRGGTVYFPCNHDISSIFEDMQLIRPTFVNAFPRILECIYTHYQTQLNQRLKTSRDNQEAIEQDLRIEMGKEFLGDRLVVIESGSAPMSDELKHFISDCFDAYFLNSYGCTETNGTISNNDIINRETVQEYKLRDVPELEYFSTDKPYPRGELCVKMKYEEIIYYKNTEATKSLTDSEGFVRTGDIVEERGKDKVYIIDRLKNIIKLTQGEFVVLDKLAILFETHSRVVHQIYCYGNSSYSYLLAVVVPELSVIKEILGDNFDELQLKQLIKSELQRVAHEQNIKAFELPKDFIIEMEPFSEKNGLLSHLHKRLKKALKDKYGERLEALYQTSTQSKETVITQMINSREDVLNNLVELLKINLNSTDIDYSKPLTYAQLGGDSLNAVSLSMAIKAHFDISWSADKILNPNGTIQGWVDDIFNRINDKKDSPFSFKQIHGTETTILKAEHLSLRHLLGNDFIESSKALTSRGNTKTVLLTGATGYLGRFICLDWLKKLAATGGKLICLIRASNQAAAQNRLDEVFIGKDKRLEEEYLGLKKDTLIVLAGDISAVNFGMDAKEYQHLAEQVDRIVHAAALVSHIMSYEDLFAPNVLGTLEIIRFALTSNKKPIDYISSIAIEPFLEEANNIAEDAPLKHEIILGNSYAVGYAASKWASEQLMRDAHRQTNLTINIFRNNMMLAHQVYEGQINTRDFFTRLIFSILVTGLAPESFYDHGRKTAHYDGIPVDIASTCIVAAGSDNHQEYKTYTMHNYHADDGFSLDVFVDWIIKAGYPVRKISNYQEWFKDFSLKLQELDNQHQQDSILALLHALKTPLHSDDIISNCDNFKHLVKSMNPKLVIPHLNEAFILKNIEDIKLHHQDSPTLIKRFRNT